MNKFLIKTQFKIVGIFLFLFLSIIFVGQGCSQNNLSFKALTNFIISSETTNNSSPSNESIAGGGNGHGYDGKMTFISVEPNYTCENKPAPKAILRQEKNKSWNLTVNEKQKCASIDKQPVIDVVYVDQAAVIKYLNMNFYIDGMAPDVPSSLAEYPHYWLVDATAISDSSDSQLGDGRCANDLGKCSLKAAIDEANFSYNSATIIKLPAATLALNSTLEMSSFSLLVVEGSGSAVSVIDGSGFTAGTSDGLFTTGAANQAGGSRVFDGLTIRNSDTKGIGQGSAVAVKSGAFSLQNSRLTGNKDNVFYSGLGAKINIENALIDQNQGIGIVASGASSLIINKVEVNQNTNSGLYILGSTYSTYIRNSSFINNAGYGLFMFQCYSGCQMQNTTIANNQLTGFYLNSWGSTIGFVVMNSTLVGNAINSGANLEISSNLTSVQSLSILNSVISNSAGGHPNCQVTNSVNLNYIVSNSITDDASCPGTGYIVANPMLSALANNGGRTLTMLPLPGSPVIDAGNNLLCASQDQRELPRPIDKLGTGAKCDIGAVELQ